MDAWEILVRFDVSDSERAEQICAELTEHHGITILGVPRAEHLREISALHISIHRCGGSLRAACEAVTRLLEDSNG